MCRYVSNPNLIYFQDIPKNMCSLRYPTCQLQLYVGHLNCNFSPPLPCVTICNKFPLSSSAVREMGSSRGDGNEVGQQGGSGNLNCKTELLLAVHRGAKVDAPDSRFFILWKSRLDMLVVPTAISAYQSGRRNQRRGQNLIIC